MYTQAFFLQKCFFNYEKEIISCAALYMASKNEYFKLKLSDFLLNYHKTKLACKCAQSF
jgi:Gpi18-like mannosyltransferase